MRVSSIMNEVKKLDVVSAMFLLLFMSFLVYFLPTPFQNIRIHDTFDGNFSTRQVLIQSGHLFDLNPTAIVPGIMNGLPRGVFPRNTEITSILMYLFGSLPGYAITFLIARLLAFIGIYKFGCDHLQIKSENKNLLIIVAVLFACLPFFIIHGLTVCGLPLLLWAFFNVVKNVKIKLSYFIFTLFVLWSNFVLVGLHLLILLGCISIFYSLKQKKMEWRLFLACTFIAVMYILSDYMLFYMHYFNSDYQTSRTEAEKFLGLNVNGVIGSSIKTFFMGDYSTANYMGFLVFPSLLALVIYYFRTKLKTDGMRLSIFLLVIYLLMVICINLLDWKGMQGFYQAVPFAKVFNLKRFTSLLPGLFFIILSWGLVISSANKWIKFGNTFLLLILYVYIWRGNISYANSGFNTTGIKIEQEEVKTFAHFFDEDLYSKIKAELGNYEGNVIHLGVSPSPSKYFGINVLDDYQGDYPLSYKQSFKKIMKGEFEKSIALKNYFEGWGARCYFYSANSFENKIESKNNFPFESSLALDTEQLKQMNCHYLISSIVVGNFKELHLTLKKVVVSALDNKWLLIYSI